MTEQEWEAAGMEAVFKAALESQVICIRDVENQFPRGYRPWKYPLLPVFRAAEREAFIEPLLPNNPLPPFIRHSHTSLLAAIKMRSEANTLRAEVFEWLVSRGDYGATDMEISEALSRQRDTLRPRRRELELAGFVKNSGKTRYSRAHCKAVVWVACTGNYWLSLIYGDKDLE